MAGGTHLVYDLVHDRIGVAGQVSGDGDYGIQQGEFVVTAGADVGGCDELLHGGLFAHADNRRLSMRG
ncbi:hypothetical protein OH768_53060 [Streptomyces sp. NBC_01622]|uniref:hypothetical protein n=1 Tax=Streptomyces sp. NBC_01622 TaxID=2975903 RepID=UPI00386E21B8|nr:hypothetical protein OH768_53060 [Streptomyces sp. NBC_01622]